MMEKYLIMSSDSVGANRAVKIIEDLTKEVKVWRNIFRKSNKDYCFWSIC